MSFLRDFLPAPVVDFLPIFVGILLALVILPKVFAKLRDSGAWDRIVDRVGGDKLRQMQFDREIQRRIKHGDIIGAANLYEEAEWYPEAINLYLEAEEYTAAGELYESLEQWDQAADMYLQVDDWKRAANVYKESGKPGKAAELMEEHGQKIDAAKLYFDAGRFDKAGQLYEEVSYFPQAGKAFENMGEFIRAAENYEKYWTSTASFGGSGLAAASGGSKEAKVAFKAGQLYEQAGDLERATEIYKRAGLAKQAAELASRMGKFDEAAEMFLKEEKLEQAAEMFAKAGNEERAALLRGEMAFHNGDNAAAAEEFLKGGDHLRAAELFEAVDDFVSAAKCYEQTDSPIQAANVYLRAKKTEEAAIMFERGGDYNQAASLYSDSGDHAKASLLFEKAGRFFDAGKLAYDLGDKDRAVGLLQRIDADSENYEAATLILSRLFIDRGMAPLAVEKLIRVLGDRPISAQTLEHFYNLGRAYEELGKTAEALETYKKVMAERYGYEDVADRIQRLSTAGSPAAPPLAPAPPAPAAARPAATPAPAAPIAGKPAQASPIQVTQELGKGLLGTTFKGVDTRNNRNVAVKFLRNELLQDKPAVQQFLAEARLARTLEHPHLVRMLGLTEIDGQKAVVMEFVEGLDLAKIVERNNRLSVKQGLDLLSTLCVALDHAHKSKLLHRDLKMSNVLVAKGGKLRLTGIGMGALRTSGLGQGEGYPAPEFLQGQTHDARSDIYSLGAMIFHGLSGKTPAEQLQASASSLTLTTLVPDVPGSFDQIITRCLEQQPSSRFQNMAELFAAARTLRS